MRNVYTVTKHELIRYFSTPLAYVYLIAFLILNSSFALYFGHFFDQGQANLLSMFAYQPWLYLLFIPGISMRLWAEEFRTKTIVQIMTMPVFCSTLVLGKFFASWIFCGLSLLLTFPFWLTVNYLGEPDNMVIFISYLGSFFIAGSMLAISQTMSALTKNQVIALVLSALVNLGFMLCGLEYILSLFRLFAPTALVDMIASFSFETHFFNITQGLVELRDIIFFFSIIILFNLTTITIVNFRTSGASGFFHSTSRRYYIFCFFLMLGGFIGLNLLANTYTRAFRYDFSEEKIFTLTESTKKILQNLPQDVTIKLYYTNELGQRNAQYRLMFDKVRLLLKQYAALSNGKLTYAVYNPVPYSRIEDYAISNGLKAIPLIETNEAAYFGLTITDALDKKTSLPLLTLERESFLEQDITEALYLLYHSKPQIGIISTLPVFETVIANVASSNWEFVNQLQRFYDVKSINQAQDISEKLQALIIIHPRDFSQEMINAVKNYTNHGGKVLLFADIATDSSRIQAPVTEKFKASDLDGLDRYWGFQFNANMTIADMDNSLYTDTTSSANSPEFTQDLLQFYITEKEINPQMPQTHNLKKLLVSSSATISPLPESKNTFIPLLTSSTNSAAVEAKWAQENYHPSILLKNFKKDQYAKVIAAHIISNDIQKPYQIIAVADTDLLFDSFWAKTVNTNDGNIIIPIFDNMNFVLNALDVLLNSDALIHLRGKSAKNRPFNDIEKIRKKARQDFSIQEYEIYQQIEKTKAGLKEIWGKKTFEGRQNFTPDELSIIANIRKTLDTQKQQLKDIRQNLNQEIDYIDFWIKFWNIYAIPLFIFSVWLILIIFRKSHQQYQEKFNFNKPLILVLIVSLILMSLGIFAVYQTHQTEQDSFQDRPLLPELQNHINQVSKINIIGHNQSLHFYKQEDEWILKEEPKFMVMQDRMRSFLSALLEARLYEKKSDKAENLVHFGLQPVTAPDSPNIRIELLGHNNQKIAALEVGKFDLEIGRSARAAYIKFDNQFQVWLANIELVDLSTKAPEWTISRLWDLRFGRLLQCNKNNNIDTLADLAKYLLNAQLTYPQTEPQTPEALFTLHLWLENSEKLDLSFWQKDDKYYVSYQFLTIPKDIMLQKYARLMQGNFYELSKTDFEKIRDIYEQKLSNH